MTDSINTSTLTSGHTTSGWVKLINPGAGNDYYVALLGDSIAGQGFEMWIDADSNIFEFYFYGAPGTYVDLPAVYDEWHHVALTVTPIS